MLVTRKSREGSEALFQQVSIIFLLSTDTWTREVFCDCANAVCSSKTTQASNKKQQKYEMD